MKDDLTLLDLEEKNKESRHKYVKYWRFEIGLTKAVYISHLMLIVSFITLTFIDYDIILLVIVLGFFAYFLLAFWQFINNIIFIFLDKKNSKMRQKYLLFALATWLGLIPFSWICEQIEPHFYYIWFFFFIFNILLFPYMLFNYYLKTLKTSIGLMEDDYDKNI